MLITGTVMGSHGDPGLWVLVDVNMRNPDRWASDAYVYNDFWTCDSILERTPLTISSCKCPPFSCFIFTHKVALGVEAIMECWVNRTNSKGISWRFYLKEVVPHWKQAKFKRSVKNMVAKLAKQKWGKNKTTKTTPHHTSWIREEHKLER